MPERSLIWNNFTYKECCTRYGMTGREPALYVENSVKMHFASFCRVHFLYRKSENLLVKRAVVV